MIWLFWSSVVFLVYTFAGYPALLWVLARFRSRAHLRAPMCPIISIIIPAHNEARRLQEKIENTLQLDYPTERREIIVASDGSTDETVAIASGFESQGVKVLELRTREGKHKVQMLARDLSRGEILVFTDASVMLDRDAMRHMVSNFADESVGCVSSEDRIVQEAGGRAEGDYVSFEMWLRRLETRVNTMVSVSGSFFAARRELCNRWHPEQSSDFFVPLHTAAARCRAVVDPQCCGYYRATAKSGHEFQRKVRTIVHGLDVFFSHWKLCNPLRYRFFSCQLVSHKLFRWLIPFSALALLISNAFLWEAGTLYRLSLLMQAGLYAGGVAALVWKQLQWFRPLKLAGFFVLGNAATIAAWYSFILGERFVAWQPTQRS